MSSDLTAIVESMTSARVACVGDVMLDRYVYGQVERISPEAPIPILRAERETAMVGGAGNVVRNLLALGADVGFVAAVGDDPAAEDIRALLKGQERVSFVLVSEEGRQTSIKTRFLAANQQILRCDRETVAPLSASARAAVVKSAMGMVPGSAVLVLSDYAKGVLDDGVAGDLIAAARTAKRPVIVDPKGRDYARYRGADVVTPNRRELAEAVGGTISPGAEAEAARKLLEDFGFAAVLVTLGRDGMVLVTARGGAVWLPAEARDVFDVSGAGDTVVATVVAALAAGAPLTDAAALANIAAGIVVAKVGTAVAYKEDVAQAIRQRDRLRAEAKIMTLGSARDRIETWRTQGLTIGFTNGCFDLLHPGHISLLAQAKDACDRLVVGLNSDASVARLKGPGRPIQVESARATVLASLANVDVVVIFAEETPLTLIETLRPDVLVKGADYRLDQVVGADLVRRYGGRVLLARLEPGYSTTTLARMAE